MEEKFKRIKEIVETELSCSAHSMDHVMRVYNLALKIAEDEDVDLDVLKASVLLHDIARVKEDNDHSGNTDHALLGSEIAENILKEMEFPEEKIEKIKHCIISHRYRTGNPPKSIEAQILFDADKLDVVGAVGVARIFIWVGRNNSVMYSEPDIDQYIKDNLGGKINGRIQDKTKHSPQIEFMTKVRFIKEKLHTEKAKEICDERMIFFKNFLDRLKKEIHGEL